MVQIKLDRLRNDLEEISKIGAVPEGGITRISYSKAALKAEGLVAEKMKMAGMRVTIDSVGNLIGRWETEKNKDSPAIIIGSHLDTVVQGGMFDGALGVLAGLECIRALRSAGIETRHPIEVISFVEEESNYYWGTFGSLAMMGRVKSKELYTKKPSSMSCLADAMLDAGFKPTQLDEARRNPKEFLAYMELHVEQGGRLESDGNPIGVVEGIVGVWRFKGTIKGKAGHAGATPMNRRDDALVKASRLFAKIPEFAASIDEKMVATVGEVYVLPGNANIIPGQVNFTLEMRAIDSNSLVKLQMAVEKYLEGCGSLEPGVQKPPVMLDRQIQEVIIAVANKEGLGYQVLPSSAGHDAMIFAQFIPTGMIFIPSAGGLSHCPEEKSDWEDVRKGTQVLAQTVLDIDGLRT